MIAVVRGENVFPNIFYGDFWYFCFVLCPSQAKFSNKRKVTGFIHELLHEEDNYDEYDRENMLGDYE